MGNAQCCQAATESVNMAEVTSSPLETLPTVGTPGDLAIDKQKVAEPVEPAPAPAEKAPEEPAPEPASAEAEKSIEEKKSEKPPPPPFKKMGEASGPVVEKDELLVEFLDDKGAPKTIAFKRRPIGIELTKNNTPQILSGVNWGGHADELGVKEFWVIQTIGGYDVSSIDDYTTMVKFFAKEQAGLPDVKKDKLVMEFVDENEKELTVEFVKRPLGIHFHRTAQPGVVGRVEWGSHAEALGVRAGWRAMSIEGKSLDTVGEYAVLAKFYGVQENCLPKNAPKGYVVPRPTPKKKAGWFKKG